MHAKCITDNANCREFEIATIENSERYDGIGVCYNRVLDSRPTNEKSWYIFCLDDLGLRESIVEKLKELDASRLLGPQEHQPAFVSDFIINGDCWVLSTKGRKTARASTP